ncbi:cell division protein ZipA [Celerinatantimonas sp. YJH-8]|uniref:cell division protein ZipA n=1 Tax=Celerinatantimonas sp. YJH-8 TaxID=3228714 RepID=UPI0038C5FF02
MQELRIVLIIVGIIVIAGLLAHGFWSNRRNQPEKLVTRAPKRKAKKKTVEPEPEVPLATKSEFDDSDEAFDELGVSQVRVIGSSTANQRQEPAINFEAASDESEEEHLVAEVTPSATEESVLEQPLPAEAEPESASLAVDEPAEAIEPDDVYVLNVIAGEGLEFEGAQLAPCLTSLGLTFGEMSIYHRHQQANGQGALLFSVANMVKPGTFDPAHMDAFRTHGVSFFMTVPCHGEPSRNFNVMYNAAQRVVNELGGVLLDGHRNPFTEQTLRHYQQRIREYERQQLLQQS